MTTLAVSKLREYELGDRNHLPVIAADIIYEGAAVGDNGSGYARPLVAADPFRGFAVTDCDNATGSAGDKRVEVRTKGRVQLAIGSLAITDVGKPVYASDDDTFTLTATSNSYIGRVIGFVSAGVGVVSFDAAKGSLGLLAAISTADGSDATTTQTLANAIKAKVNAILAQLA